MFSRDLACQHVGKHATILRSNVNNWVVFVCNGSNARGTPDACKPSCFSGFCFFESRWIVCSWRKIASVTQDGSAERELVGLSVFELPATP